MITSFIYDYCVGWHNFTYEQCVASTSDLPAEWTDFTVWYNMAYNLGCLGGAFVGGIVADKLGRRWTIFTAGLLFCIGTSWVCFNKAQEHGLMYIARVIQGFGVGNSSFSLPLFGAEMAPQELRGLLSGFMQMTVVTGLFLANAVNIIVENRDRGWRTTNGVAMAAPIVVLLGIFFVPESPRWTYLHKGKEEAERVLKRLRQTDNVGHELQVIGDQVEEELAASKGLAELLEPAIFKRVVTAMLLQVLQQATGINPIMSYGALIFKDITNAGIYSAFFISGVNFLSTIPAMRWVDTFGRRQLLLIGAVGMVTGHLFAAILFTAICGGNVDNAGCPKVGGWFICLGSAFFVFNFAISWGPVCWIYPAEIFPLGVRASAVSLSTAANWAMGAVMTEVVKLFPHLNINGVFFLFAGLCCICGIFVYFFCPETKGIMLEDIEELFHRGQLLSWRSSPRNSQWLSFL
ncbi:Major Facilitator Superfamily (MFS) [Phytophthora infestans T30-4]|uniref:Hexose transporter 1 n=2 Tax=Phytophthora infestans TaxID=4787 RepID=D0N8Y5_PHYIT|nr:Major Facilitator Superfamily (MFS) [Phytophthora infestans T30-4]EEY54020.1 Major Facilitator Superfamily (MFS) [Phytophthora infestans T30-4]KAF4037723.1 Sugar (and other) transporter [Phytophthora infestans]KAF4143229.1 Sugar (and other) transporter [Phytophthora infestans]|eukprot:XP_002904651.1 Major Facilitator Superfamily (MFS) [Phytophthora infestans T30-4]